MSYSSKTTNSTKTSTKRTVTRTGADGKTYTTMEEHYTDEDLHPVEQQLLQVEQGMDIVYTVLAFHAIFVLCIYTSPDLIDVRVHHTLAK